MEFQILSVQNSHGVEHGAQTGISQTRSEYQSLIGQPARTKIPKELSMGLEICIPKKLSLIGAACSDFERIYKNSKELEICIPKELSTCSDNLSVQKLAFKTL